MLYMKLQYYIEETSPPRSFNYAIAMQKVCFQFVYATSNSLLSIMIEQYCFD